MDEGAAFKKIFIELPSILKNYVIKRLRYFKELHEIEPVKNDILLFSGHYGLVIQTLNEQNFDLSSVLTLEFDVKIDECEMRVEGEHVILGKYCLKMGTFEKMKEPLEMPKSLQKFTLDIEVSTLNCKDLRRRNNPKWVLKMNTLMDGSTELKWFSHIELMQSVQQEKDLKQMEQQKKLQEFKQRDMENVNKQLGNLEIANTQAGATPGANGVNEGD